jgi:hypothetical protein
MFAAGVLVGIPCGVGLILYLITKLPRTLSKICSDNPKGK